MSDDTEPTQSELKVDTLKKTLATSVLELEEIDINLYRGSNLWKPFRGRAVFGGQVLGQALVAASKTKLPGYHVHSLHCYFVRPGRDDIPIVYHVTRTRDGSSFLSRIVTATQTGETILTMIVSFQRFEEIPIFHQYTMPTAPPPEELNTTEELLRIFLDTADLPERRRTQLNKVLAQDIPIEVKPIDAQGYIQRRYAVINDENAKPMEAKSLLWIRARGNVGGSDHNLHRCMAAYISDWTLLGTSLIPHVHFRPMMMASLDHSMWFHTNFRADDWMLYEAESPKLVNGRGFVLGRLWRRDGTLAVSVAQEGIIRGDIVMAKL